MRRLLLVFLTIGSVAAYAQSAADQYHSAAGFYIHGELEAAEQAAEAGLAIAPNDAKLQSLLERIRQQQNQQNQQQQNDESEEQQDDQENEGEPDQPNSEQQNQERDDPERGSQDQPQDDSSAESDRQEEQPQPEQQNQNGNQGDQQQPDKPQAGASDGSTGDAQPVQPGRMSRAQAERILGALRADESALLRSIQRRPANPRRVERDW